MQQLTDRLHFKSISEGTKLVAARLFEEGDGYGVVGIGGSMLCSWDTNQKKFQTIPVARLVVSEKMHQEAKAIFPNAFKPEEVHIFDTMISKTSFIFVMSDGGYEFLPVLKNREQYSNDRSVDVITLDNEAMSQYLSSMSVSLTASDYIDVLIKQGCLMKMALAA